MYFNDGSSEDFSYTIRNQGNVNFTARFTDPYSIECSKARNRPAGKVSDILSGRVREDTYCNYVYNCITETQIHIP